MNIFSLEGKCVTAFGGAGYLGIATVEAMLDLGAKVLIADRFPDYAKEYVAHLESNPACELFPCNAGNVEDIRAALDACEQKFGKVTNVVNFIAYGPAGGSKPIESCDDETFQAGLEGSINVMFRVLREAIPYLEKNESSSIVNTGSMYGIVSPDPGIYGTSGQNNPVYYGAGKAGVIQLTRYAAGHLAKRGIRVNCVSPGPFPDSRKLPPKEFLDELSKKTMLGRIGRNTEIAGAYCYLLSDAATFTTGANVVVDGGWTAW